MIDTLLPTTTDRIVIKGKILHPERKKYERYGCCPKCLSKNYTYVEIDREYHMLCHKCNYEVGVPYTEEGIKSILTDYKEYYGNKISNSKVRQ